MLLLLFFAFNWGTPGRWEKGKGERGWMGRSWVPVPPDPVVWES